MLAKKDFHSVNGIPDGATLTVVASDISGNVQATAMFLSGSDNVPDANWTLADMESGRANTGLAGPGISIARVLLVLFKGASAQIDMTIQDKGKEIRRRTWKLASPDADTTGRLGWIISVDGANL